MGLVVLGCDKGQKFLKFTKTQETKTNGGPKNMIISKSQQTQNFAKWKLLVFKIKL